MHTLKFDELNLSKEIIRAIADLGFEEATPIQSQSIPLLLEGKDVIGQAQTGTGKTAAFGIPAIEKIDPAVKDTQVIVLCPTRELAIQVAEGLSDLIKYKKGIRVIPIYGGQSIERQVRAVRKGAHIIIATPGRLLDHIDRKTVQLENVSMFVLDEADEMLNMGFIDDIEKILKRVPKKRQTVLFSATMPKPILELSKKYLSNPEHIKVVHKELTVPSIQQFYYEVKPAAKLDVLTRLIDLLNPKLSLVFCNTKRGADNLVSHLDARGYLADALHGDLRQNQRDKVMAKFRNGKIDILVATDVAARGIDVDDIDVVFNYDMPQDEEYYVHRIGRTARAGRTGQAHTLVVGREFRTIKEIERYTNSKIVRKQPPTREDVAELKTSSFLDDIRSVIEKGELQKYEHYIESLVEEDFTTFEISAALVKMLLKSGESKVNEDTEVNEHSFRKEKKEKRRDFDSTEISPRHEKFQKRDKFTSKDKFTGKDRFTTKDKFTGKDKFLKKEKTSKKDKFKKEKKEYKKDSTPEQGMSRLYMNAGKKNNISAGDIVGAFAGETGIPASSIGVIDIYDKFSFVDVKTTVVNRVLSKMDGNFIKGKQVNIQESKK